MARRAGYAMPDLLPFLVIGIASGSVYGLAAMGLVLTYKTSGIFNFAHGAVAAVAAFVYYELHAVRGLPWPVALAIAVVVLPPVIGRVMELITRALSGGTVMNKIVGTIGLQLIIVGTLMALYGAVPVTFPGFLPTNTVDLLGIMVGIDQLITMLVAAAGALGFFLFFRLSPVGLRMRAVVDNPELLAMAGTNPLVVRSWAWTIGLWFAAISGILLAPQLGLDTMLLTLLVVQAFGAAAVGLFSSLPLTYAGGLLVGVLAALSTQVAAAGDSQILTGLPPAVPFVVLFAVLLLVRRGKLREAGGHVTAPQTPPLLTPQAARIVSVLVIAVAVLIPFLVGTKLPIYSSALVLVLIFYSLYLLVRISGQVSLAHPALVAVGAAAFSHLDVGAGLPWLLAVLIAGAITVPVGLVVAIPAIRLSGLFLALATYGFMLLMERMLYRSNLMFGTESNQPASRPEMFAGDAAFYYVLLAFTILSGLLVATITRSRLGRLLRAMADSPTTLSTLGLGVNVTRTTVFAITAFLAGMAGSLYASEGRVASSLPFTSHEALIWVTILALVSGLRSGAPVAAAISLVIIPSYITNDTAHDWLPVLFGLGALVIASREAAAAKHHTAGHSAGHSRMLERFGASGPARERLDAADLVAHPSSAAPQLRLCGRNRAQATAVSRRVGSPQ